MGQKKEFRTTFESFEVDGPLKKSGFEEKLGNFWILVTKIQRSTVYTFFKGPFLKNV